VATVWGFEDFWPQALGLMRAMTFKDPDIVAESILRRTSPRRASSRRQTTICAHTRSPATSTSRYAPSSCARRS
jgi:hypothetical protein